jgi:hypothetical protein
VRLVAAACVASASGTCQCVPSRSFAAVILQVSFVACLLVVGVACMVCVLLNPCLVASESLVVLGGGYCGF